MRLLTSLFFATALLTGVAPIQAADTPAKTRVLLITGDDVSAHDWLSCALATLEVKTLIVQGVAWTAGK